MQASLKELFLRIKRIKNIGLISVRLLLGVMLCVIEVLPVQNGLTGGRLEDKIERLCCELVGEEVYVSVNTGIAGEPVGIALILNKEDNARIKLELTQMLSTLYGIPSSRIYVGVK